MRCIKLVGITSLEKYLFWLGYLPIQYKGIFLQSQFSSRDLSNLRLLTQIKSSCGVNLGRVLSSQVNIIEVFTILVILAVTNAQYKTLSNLLI